MTYRRLTVVVVVGGVSALLIGVACQIAGMLINTTRSIPIGVYWKSSAPPVKDAYVLVCPPVNPIFDDAKRRGYISAGWCPGDYGYLMKRIVAVAGDVITATALGVSVNGERVPNSAPITQDRAARPMPRFRADQDVLGESDILLMSDGSHTAFDGRYFGPIDASHVVTVVVPILTIPLANARKFGIKRKE